MLPFNPAVSVIIPCRNEADCLANCLKSVLAQQPPPGGFEVIVADGMSVDGTRALLESARLNAGVRIIDNPKMIVSAGLNAGIRAAKGDIIVRMDAHTEYAADYVRQCVRILAEKGVDNVGGPARTKANTRAAKAIAAAYHSPFAVGGARFHNVEYEGLVDTVTYGCWRREAFKRYGLFDEELVRNQDDEHNLRITRSGGKIWQSPQIKSWYAPRGSLGALFAQYRQYGYWKVRVIQKHSLPASPRHLVPGVFVLALSLLALITAVSAFLQRFGSSDLLRWLWLMRFAGIALVILVVAYGSVIGWASIQTAKHNGWKLLPLLPATFWCYHIGYGVGFLQGIWDFIILERSPHSWACGLTRGRS